MTQTMDSNLFAGVSIASVATRLGHSSMTTTQETYLHIIQELENQDNESYFSYINIAKWRIILSLS
jgi:integrase